MTTSKLWLGLVLCITAAAGPAAAIMVGSFGPNGSVRVGTTDSISIGAGAEVFELDAFVHLAGQDLNGPALGESARLSQDPLPSGLDVGFCHD